MARQQPGHSNEPSTTDSSIVLAPLNQTDAAAHNRYTIVAEAHQKDATTQDQILICGTDYYLDLFNDFTYFLTIQFAGTNSSSRTDGSIRNSRVACMGHQGFRPRLDHTIGLQAPNDDINNGLFDTEDRIRYNTVETAGILESSVGVDVENRTQWLPKFRTEGGLRGDYYNFHVHSSVRGQLRRPNAGNLQSETQPHLWTMVEDRILPQRRLRISQQ